MDLVLLLLTLAVVAVIVAVVLGRLPGGMPEPSSTVPPVSLPSGPLTGADVQALRFVPGLRGYRMDQVDDALEQLGAEVDRLRGLVPPEVLRAHDSGQLSGQLPGQFPGQLPGQEASRFPGQFPDQFSDPEAGQQPYPPFPSPEGSVARGGPEGER